jgi:hypothetical protein
MVNRQVFKGARCAVCGASADVEKDLVGFHQRDVALCKHPPIETCPEMKAAISETEAKAGRGT